MRRLTTCYNTGYLTDGSFRNFDRQKYFTSGFEVSAAVSLFQWCLYCIRRIEAHHTMSARVPYLTWSANNTFSQWGGDWLRTWNPAVGDEKPADSSAYWYTSANDVFLLHVYGLPGLSLLVWALCKNTTPWPVAVRRAKLTNVVSGCWQRFLAATDMVLRALCLVALSATVYYKIAGERVAYLGQPCHWLCGLLAFLSFRSDSDKAASPIFNL